MLYVWSGAHALLGTTQQGADRWKGGKKQLYVYVVVRSSMV